MRINEILVETIRKQGNKYIVYSKDGDKKLGTYNSRKAAEKRLRQIEYFKHNESLIEALGEIASATEIYVDMDGVLADFFGEWARLMDVEHFTQINKKHDIDDALQKIRDTDDFWLRLPMLPEAKNLLNLIKQVKGSYNICSSPLADDPNSEKHKRTWVKQNLDFFPPDNVYITHNKPKYATQADGTPNILIDDYGKNIAAWEAAGGIGFKHKDHKFERTAKNIKQHMQEPVEENLTERRMADLYHNSNDGDKILKSGVIKTSMPEVDIYDEPTEREKEIGPRISLTRDFHYDWAPHKFVIDQAKLASRQKIIPIDTQNPTYDERRVESEEYVLKPITLDMIKAVILPDIEKGYENNLEVAKLALDKGIDVFVGKHPRKLTPVTKEDLSDAPPKDAVAVITEPGFTPFELGQLLTQAELDSAYDEYEDDFEFDMLESIDENFADGKNPGRKGLSQRVGIPKNATIAQLEKAAKAGGEKGRLARWQLNMRRGRKKK